MKYTDSEDNIKEYFGYNRSNNRFKTCIRCRSSKPKVSKPIIEIEPEIPEPVYEIAIDATDVSVLLGVSKYNENLYNIIIKYWKRGFPFSYVDRSIEMTFNNPKPPPPVPSEKKKL